MLEELQVAFAKVAFFDTLIAIVGAVILLIPVTSNLYVRQLR